MANPNARNSNIELLRVICFCAIVFIHVNAEGFFTALPQTGFFLDAAARFGVPVFFLISGFFFKDTYLASALSYMRYGAKKILLPYVIWFVVYNYELIFVETNFVRWKAVKKLLFHFFVKGGEGYHLWFLPSLFVGATLICLLARFPRYLRAALFLSLFVIGVGMQEGWLAGPLPSWSFRNGIFFAPVFLFVGQEIQRRHLRPGTVKSLFIALAGLALHLAESKFFVASPDQGLNLSFGVLFYATGIFLLFLSLRGAENFFSRLGKLVFGAYCVHALWIYAFKWPALPPTPLLPFGIAGAVIILSLLASWRLARIPQTGPQAC